MELVAGCRFVANDGDWASDGDSPLMTAAIACRRRHSARVVGVATPLWNTVDITMIGWGTQAAGGAVAVNSDDRRMAVE